MGKDSFLLFTDHLELVKELSDEQAGKLFKGVLLYASGDKSVHFDDVVVRVAFISIKSSIDRAEAKYDKICQRNRENGAKGGRPKSDNPDEPKKPSGLSGNPDEPKITLPDRNPDIRNPDIKKSTLSGTCPRQADGPSNCPHQKIVDLWNETLPELPQVKIVSEARKKSIRARWREDKQRQNVDWWKGFFEYIRTCSFLMGASNSNDRAFELTFDWMLKPRNFVKIVEGNYVDR